MAESKVIEAVGKALYEQRRETASMCGELAGMVAKQMDAWDGLDAETQEDWKRVAYIILAEAERDG
jgi:hypothetical protein